MQNPGYSPQPFKRLHHELRNLTNDPETLVSAQPVDDSLVCKLFGLGVGFCGADHAYTDVVDRHHPRACTLPLIHITSSTTISPFPLDYYINVPV